MKKRSDELYHAPRGIKKWAPFNSLPEFTEKQKQLKKQTIEDNINLDYDEDKEYYFYDIFDEE